MAFRLFGAKPLLPNVGNLSNGLLRISLSEFESRDKSFLSRKYTETVVFKMVVILFRPQCVQTIVLKIEKNADSPCMDWYREVVPYLLIAASTSKQLFTEVTLVNDRLALVDTDC